MGWSLIVRLTEKEAPTVCWQDGHEVEWASVTRFKRTDGVDLSGLIDAAFTAPVLPLSQRETTPVVSTSVEGRRGRRAVEIHHVVDTRGVACGLQAWVADPEVEMEPRPRAAGFMYEHASGHVTNSEDTWLLGASTTEGYGRVGDPDQFLNQVVRADDVVGTMELVAKPPLRESQIARTTLLHKDGHLDTVVTPARVYPDGVRFLTQVITPWAPPEIDPATAMRLADEAGDQLCALVSFTDDLPAIVYWAISPPSWVAYWSGKAAVSRDDRGVLHEGDRTELASACEQLDSGAQTAALTLRLRAIDGGWRAVSATLTRYPSQTQMRFYVMTMTPGTEL